MMQNEANLLSADRQWARGGKVALPVPPGRACKTNPIWWGQMCETNPIWAAPAAEIPHHSTIPSFQNSNVRPTAEAAIV
jgi:hypothetical protein